jgi:DNA primase
MPRIPDHELERLKREANLAALVRASGIELKRHGSSGDLAGRCPFHEDRTPSLVISPRNGEPDLWHCLGACQVGGTAIDWLMKLKGVSFRHAVELLREAPEAPKAPGADVSPEAGQASAPSRGRGKAKTAGPSLSAPVDLEAADHRLMRQVLDYYHQRLKHPGSEARAYLQSRGLESEAAMDRFCLGYADGTLGLRLPHKRRKDGARVRGQLQKLGLYRDTGREHFDGCLVMPIFDGDGHVVQIYGRKLSDANRGRRPSHLYLPGPLRGVWNPPETWPSDTPQDELILCESIIDALTLWVHGFTHVTASYGIEGFTDDHLAMLKRWAAPGNGGKRLLIAYDRDDAGENAAHKLSERLLTELPTPGVETWRVQLPKGMDVNQYAQKVQPAAKSLALVLRKATWLGKSAGEPTSATIDAPGQAEGTTEATKEREASAEPSDTPDQARKAQSSTADTPRDQPAAPGASGASSLAAAPLAVVKHAPASQPADTSTTATSAAAESPASPQSTQHASPPRVPSGPEVQAEVKDQETIISIGDRRYRVRGLERNMSYDQLKVNLLVMRVAPDGEALPGVHVDTFDLYAAKARKQFIGEAARELGLEEKRLKAELGQVLLKLEQLQDQQIQAAQQPEQEDTRPQLNESERQAALGLLRDPNLMDRILQDFEASGVVGERTNKLVGYLAATSRKLAQPLAVVIQSSSAAGKSSLMDAVLSFMPPEEVTKYSAMTGQSLFYMGETDLKHQVLAVAEEEGAERASYALKLLQSEGELTIASTGKDPQTGRLETQQYHVEGPVMIFLTTTAIEVDEELLNRCVVLSVDEDQGQTKAIHQLQRQRQTLQGLLASRQAQQRRKVHRDAQRLLQGESEGLLVANPYAERLTFLDGPTRRRRDHLKYLTLIRTIALLHQYQRPRKQIEHPAGSGQTIDYIEVEPSDIETANRLAHEVLGRSLDELPPRTRRLLELLDAMVQSETERLNMERSDYRFTRREVRQYTGWGDTQLKVHLGRLAELEYVLMHRSGRGQSFVYELLYTTAPGNETDGEADTTEANKALLAGLIDPSKLTADHTGQSTDNTDNANRSGFHEGQSATGRGEVGAWSGHGRPLENAANPANNGTNAPKAGEAMKTTAPGDQNTPARRSGNRCNGGQSPAHFLPLVAVPSSIPNQAHGHASSVDHRGQADA